MIIVMKPEGTKANIESVMRELKDWGIQPNVVEYNGQCIISFQAEEHVLKQIEIVRRAGVEQYIHLPSKYDLTGRALFPKGSVINVGGVKIGGGNFVTMAGPCAVESRAQLLAAAEIAKKEGANFLRGGAYKPRTSPYSFRGLQDEGLKYLAEAREKTGLRIISEITDHTKIEKMALYVDMFQVGARNMQNFTLLSELGKSGKPVLLKRGLSASIDEWINAAEYIMMEGNFNVVFCERGIRTYESYTRNTLDLSAVAVIKRLSHLPVIVDPSHGTGKSWMVKPMALAAVCAGADGLMVEMHPSPEKALSDGQQSLTPENYGNMMHDVLLLHNFIQREKITSLG